jgi:hypothetical protein
MDLSADEAGMKQCVNGHTYCDEHGEDMSSENKIQAYRSYLNSQITRYSKLAEDGEERHQDWLNEAMRELDEFDSLTTDDECLEVVEGSDFLYDLVYEMPPEFCPCCRFETVATGDIIKYFYKKHNTSAKELAAEMQEKFENYEEFKKYIKGE